jgi:hypothetical protein
MTTQAQLLNGLEAVQKHAQANGYLPPASPDEYLYWLQDRPTQLALPQYAEAFEALEAILTFVGAEPVEEPIPDPSPHLPDNPSETLFVALASKHPHTTLWVETEHDTHQPDDFDALAAALAGIGYEQDDHPAPPLPDGFQKISFFKPGSGLFHIWTDQEYPVFLAEVRQTLAKFGFKHVPRHRLTLADLL